MEEEPARTYNRSRELLTTTIPKNIGYMVERATSSSSNSGHKPPTDPNQRPPSPILERFRACLREREEEMGVEGASPEEIVRLYQEALTELIFNSKPIITDLTIIAGEHLDCGKGIAAAICSRILEVPAEQKLPSLYLLDSIVKNIRDNYVRYFAARLPEVFCEAYKQVLPSLYPAMRHLFRTWADVFPPSVLRTIEAELQFSPRANFPSSSLTSSRTSESQSPRRAHSIHVNPKYLVARRQFEHSDVMHKTDPHYNARMADFEGESMEREPSASPKGWSGAHPKFHNMDHARSDASSMQICEKNSLNVYGDYDFDHGEVLTPQIGGRVGSTSVPVGGSSSSIIGAEKLLSPSRIKRLRPYSPSNIGHRRSLSPSVGSLARDISPRSIAEMPSPSQTEFGITRAVSMIREKNDWSEGRFSDDGAPQLEASRTFSLYNLNNGFDQRRLPQTRALIDAYGNYRGKPTFYGGEVSKVERIEENGINKEVSRKWQNSEEEEYVWEDMSPTLSDRSRSNDVMLPDSSARSLIMKSGLGKSNAGFVESEFSRGSWLGRSLQMMDDHALISEDRNSTLSVGHGSISRKTQHGSSTQDEVLYHPWGSRGAQEHGKLPYQVSPSMQQYPNPIPRPRAFPSSYIDNPFHKSKSNQSNMGSLYPNPLNWEGLSPVTPVSTSMFSMEKHLVQWPQPKYNPFPSLPIVPHQKQFKTQFDSMDVKKSQVNQSPNQSLVIPLQQLDAIEKKTVNSTKPLPLQQAGLISLNHPSREQAGCLLPQLLQPLEAKETICLPVPGQIPSHLQSNSLLGISPPPMPVINMPTNISSHMLGNIPPPLPPGPPPLSSQLRPPSQNMGPILPHPPTGSDYSSILSTLMAQGVISLQGSIGVEFDQELLKGRHESAINALYADLPRQCTTCGLRLKCQEEHSNHMDWHVTKNRMSRNRKQKTSRKWFVSAKEWLSGTEALGTEAVPGFLPAEVVLDRKDDQEMAVPADENQNVCALCGEPFEDFYSDEAEEWMYKGAVYLNAPEGSIEGIDRSLLGPIVHAKCRSESTTDSHVAFQGDEMGNVDDLGDQRKKMRI